MVKPAEHLRPGRPDHLLPWVGEHMVRFVGVGHHLGQSAAVQQTDSEMLLISAPLYYTQLKEAKAPS